MQAIRVPPATAPVRLDVFLARHVPHCSRRTAQRAIADGAVRINGRRARKGELVTDDDLIQVADELYAPPALQPNPELALRILYEDAAVIAIDKPAGMPSQALHVHEIDTVANFLLARYRELAAVGTSKQEAGLVHRLDVDTSGVLLAARTEHAYRFLRQEFSQHRVGKEYLALVEGKVAASEVVCTAIAHDRRKRRRMRVTPSTGRVSRPREAVTHFRPLERFRDSTLVMVEIATGVMHQIRVHLASVGHPIIGDRLYGKTMRPAPRQLLHAGRLSFTHPDTRQPLEVRCPLPADFAEFLNGLRETEQAAG
ncbi:MAG: RluA family pseudouridine synthase [Candidatus Binatia bacterium]